MNIVKCTLSSLIVLLFFVDSVYANTYACAANAKVLAVYVNNDGWDGDHSDVGIEVEDSVGKRWKYNTSHAWDISSDFGQALYQIALFAFVSGTRVHIYRSNLGSDDAHCSYPASDGWISNWGGIALVSPVT